MQEVTAEKRILWLLNHTTLRECEIPLLMEMGYEVYTPKRFPRNADNRSASITYEFDASLSIPQEELDILNDHDFYGGSITPRVNGIINKYFSTAIIAYMFPMVDVMIRRFKGRLLLRAFGLTHPDYTYYSFAEAVIGKSFRRNLSRVSDRFWFAAGYDNLADIEPRIVQDRAAYLPVGLPKRVIDLSNTWRGGDNRIMFVCPDINTYSEARTVYEEFKAGFGDIPHVICGSQTVPVDDDPNVVGRLSAEEYERLFRECAVMFYHSKLPRHIHYHPVEAACYGMPLIYMSQGMLGTLGGLELPGAAATFKEARSKIMRLRDASQVAFKQDVISSQSKIVDHFLPPAVERAWRRNFQHSIMTKEIQPRRSLSIAIIACDPSYKTLRHSTSLLEQLIEKKTQSEYNLNLILGEYAKKGQYYKPLDPEMVAVRRFIWRQIEGWRSEIACRLQGVTAQPKSITYSVPEDDAYQFLDCDVWVLVGDVGRVALLPLKPIAYLSTSDLKRDFYKNADSRTNFAYNIRNTSAILSLSSKRSSDLQREFGVNTSTFVDIGKQDEYEETFQVDASSFLSIIEAIA